MKVIAVGLGCRKGCAGAEIVRLVQLALEQANIERATGLFAPAFKDHESGLSEAASTLGLPLVLLPDVAMKAAEKNIQTVSARVVALTGLGSVAEAAALAGAGPGSRLIVPRIASPSATCAIALSKDLS